MLAIRVARVPQAQQEDRQGNVQEDVRQDSASWSEEEHQPATDRGSEQRGEVTAGGVETDGARKMVGTHDVVDDQLDRGPRDDAARAMDEEERGRVPHAQRPGQEEHAPHD